MCCPQSICVHIPRTVHAVDWRRSQRWYQGWRITLVPAVTHKCFEVRVSSSSQYNYLCNDTRLSQTAIHRNNQCWSLGCDQYLMLCTYPYPEPVLIRCCSARHRSLSTSCWCSCNDANNRSFSSCSLVVRSTNCCFPIVNFAREVFAA